MKQYQSASVTAGFDERHLPAAQPAAIVSRRILPAEDRSMDRREFLSTSGAAALGLAVAVALRAGARAAVAAGAAPPRRRATPRSTRCSKRSSRSRCEPRRLRHLPRARQGRARRRFARKLDTRPDQQARRGGAGADQASSSAARSGARSRPVADRGAQPRSRAVGSQDRQCRPRAVRHRQPAKPLCDQPAGRRLFLDPRLPRLSAHDRQCGRRRGLSVAPRAIRHRARQ